MSFPYQIRSFDEYKAAYKKSVDDPEGFWAGIAGHFFFGVNGGTKCWNGISANRKLNGLKVAGSISLKTALIVTSVHSEAGLLSSGSPMIPKSTIACLHTVSSITK